jgi:flagellar protein FliS
MLYERVTLSLREAISAIEAGEVETRWRANARAIEILNHMWSTLNVEKGGDIAKNLDSLFSYMLSRLPEVDLHNDPEPAREVIALLEPLRESWRELAKRELTPKAGGYAQPSPGKQDNNENKSPAPGPTSFSA